MRSVKVLDFVKVSLESIKDELNLKSESEAIFYLINIYSNHHLKTMLADHQAIVSEYRAEKKKEEYDNRYKNLFTRRR